MHWPSLNLLSHPPPVLRRWTLCCLWMTMTFSALAVAWVVLRGPLGLPRRGWFRFVPLALGLTPILIILPLWYARTGWIRRALRESGWRLCTHCAYDVSTLTEAGICPECGKPFDVGQDAPLWEDVGVERPALEPRDRTASK